MAVDPKRDWDRVRDRIISIVSSLAGTKFGIMLTIILCATIGYFFKVDFVVLIAVFIGAIIVLMFVRILYFYDIPRGWTYGIFRHWISIGGKDPISRHRKWVILSVAGIVIINVTVGVITLNPASVLSLIGSLGVIAMFLKGYKNFWWSRQR